MRFCHGDVEYHLTFRRRARIISLFLKVRDPVTGKVELLQHLILLYAGADVLILHDGVHGVRDYELGKVNFENDAAIYEYDNVSLKPLKKLKK